MLLKDVFLIGAVCSLAYGAVLWNNQRVESSLVKMDGVAVLSKWETTMWEVKKDEMAQVMADPPLLFGYGYGRLDMDGNFHADGYHFEEARWVFSLNKNYEQHLSKETLNRDFRRLWTFLNHVGKNDVDSVEVRKWENTLPAGKVAITFCMSVKGNWVVWVNGMRIKEYANYLDEQKSKIEAELKEKRNSLF